MYRSNIAAFKTQPAAVIRVTSAGQVQVVMHRMTGMGDTAEPFQKVFWLLQ